ncbi:MAG: hypothetical protein QOE33_82 [Acidobacteriota bacterium]|nr:hypothetical protein [Acidobacteriota bacterium]
MSDKISDTAEVVKGIVEAVPVYQDVAQPAAKEIGTALQTVAKTIHIALAPLSMLVWSYEQIKSHLESELLEKFKNTPSERIVTPSPSIAGPAIESLRFNANEPSLRELYINLLATSMDADTAHNAHPAFVEIIKQISPDEARVIQVLAPTGVSPIVSAGSQYLHGIGERSNHLDIEFLKHFSLLPYDANCLYPDLFPSYLDNLNRLGLVQLKEDYYLAGENIYERLENHPRVLEALADVKSKDYSFRHIPSLRREALFLTNLGRQFCAACVTKNELP